jgi:hypothetical protein
MRRPPVIVLQIRREGLELALQILVAVCGAYALYVGS